MAFFDELSKKITSTASKAGQVAGDTAEIAKLKMQISSEQEKIRKAYAELGKQYYEAHRNDSDNEFAALISTINASYTAIQDANVSIQEHKTNISAPIPAAPASPVRPAAPANTQICPTCGNHVQAGARFCTFCGTEMPVPQLCTGCGAVIEPGTKFCTSCGTPVQTMPVGPAALPIEEPVQEAELIQPIELPEPEVSFEPIALPEADEPESI